MTKSRIQINRSSVTRQRPLGRDPGELYVNWADKQIGSIGPANEPIDLVGVRFFTETAQYEVNEFVVRLGELYRAIAPSPAGPFNPSNWVSYGLTTTDIDWNQIVNKPATFPPTLPILQSDVLELIGDLALKAPLLSPQLTGTPTTPTAAPGTNDTQIASTAFVQAAVGAESEPIVTPTGTDLAALNTAAAAAAAAGAMLLLQRTVYTITDTWVLPDGLVIEGNGATIDGSGIAGATALGQKFGVLLQGSIGSTVAVTADLAKGTKTIPVASTAGLAVNDTILIQSNEVWPPGAVGTANRKGSMHRIRSIDSGTSLTIYDGTFFSFSGATIAKASLRSAKISNLNVAMGGTGKAHNGFGLIYTAETWLMNCSARGAEDCGVRALYCYGGGITGGFYRDATSPNAGGGPVTGNTGYGVVVADGCRNFKVEKARFRNNRHSIAGGGIHPPVLIDIIGNYVEGSVAGAGVNYDIECHEDCMWWTFSKNQISGSNDSAGSGGLMVRGQGCIVSENHIVSARQYGIYVHGFDVNPNGVVGCKVINNHVENARLSGISIAGDPALSPCFDIEVRGNTVRGAGGDGIVAKATSGLTIADNVIEQISNTNQNGVRLVGSVTAGDVCTDFTIENNRVDTTTLYGFRVDYAQRGVLRGNSAVNAANSAIETDSCTEIEISGGYLKTAGPTIHGIRITNCTKMMIRPGVMDGGGGASSSAGVSISGTCSDISVSGGIISGYQYPVRATGTVDYIMVEGVDGRGCNVVSDIATPVNKVAVGNLPDGGAAFTGVLAVPAGSITAPSINFAATANTGLYGTNNMVSVTTEGLQRWAATSFTVSHYVVTRAAAGAVSGPSYSFTNDTNAGLYSLGTGDVRMAMGGADVVKWLDDKSSTFSGTIIGISGTAALPSVVFATGTTTGIYGGSTSMGVSVAGVSKMVWSGSTAAMASNYKFYPAASTTTRAGFNLNNASAGVVPSAFADGDVWMTQTGVYCYVGTTTRPMSIHVGTTAPSAPITNDLWLDTN